MDDAGGGEELEDGALEVHAEQEELEHGEEDFEAEGLQGILQRRCANPVRGGRWGTLASRKRREVP